MRWAYPLSLARAANRTKAVEKKFSPEFVNRIQHKVVFRSLSQESIFEIFEIELRSIRARILKKLTNGHFTIMARSSAKQYLIEQGFNPKYGARSLKRVLERDLVAPIANLHMSGQIEHGDIVVRPGLSLLRHPQDLARGRKTPISTPALTARPSALAESRVA